MKLNDFSGIEEIGDEEYFVQGNMQISMTRKTSKLFDCEKEALGIGPYEIQEK